MNEASAMVAIFFRLLNLFLIFLYKIWTMLVQNMPFLWLKWTFSTFIYASKSQSNTLTYGAVNRQTFGKICKRC